MASRTPGIKHLKPSRRYPKGGWEVRYRDAGNMTRRKTFEAKQDAVAFKEAVNTDRRRGDLPDLRLAQRPFEEVAEAWYAEASKRLRPKTLAGYRYTLDSYLLPALGHRPIGKITPLVLRQVLAELPDHLSPTTKRNIFRALSPVFKQAVADGMIRSNPTPHVKLPRANRRSMPVLTAEQVEALANEVGPRYSTLVRFAAYTGLRAGEIAALRVKDFDPLRGRVTVRQSLVDVHGRLHFGPPKNGRVRSVSLPGFLVEQVAAHLAARPHEPDNFIFSAENGGPFRHSNFYGRAFKPAVSQALPEHLHGLRFHDLRHTCAALLIAQGTHPKAISDRLGHSSISVTMDIYGHLFPEQDEKMAAGLDAVYQQAVEDGGRSGQVVGLR